MSLNKTSFFSDKINVVPFYFYLTTVANVVFILFAISLLNNDGLNVFINSDTLYLPSIYQDITEFGHTLKNWHLNPAPNFFPDMLLYAAIAIFSNNFITAFIVFAVVQYLLIVFLASNILKVCVSKKEKHLILTLGNLLLMLIPLSTYFANDFHFSFHLISNAFHNGAFINALIALNLLVRFFLKKSHIYLVFLSLLIFVAVISDRFFIFYFILPSFWVASFSLLNRDFRKKALVYIITIIIITAISITTFNLLKAFKILVVFNRAIDFNGQMILDSWNMFAEQFVYYFTIVDSRSFTLYLSIVSMFLLGRFITLRIKNKKLNDLILFLNNNLEQNKEKVALYSVVDNTRDAFYHKLRELYPKLNEKETRVAAYVRLNLASKQIGIQLNITKASVDNYRYSLRKKMGVPKDVFLYDFIKKI